MEHDIKIDHVGKRWALFGFSYLKIVTNGQWSGMLPQDVIVLLFMYLQSFNKIFMCVS
jgi:hypothetical protein